MRAHNWKQQLFSSDAPTIKAIAENGGSNECHVGRILRLAFLAADIVEAILVGRQPADLDLDRVRGNIPLAWTDQRRVSGFQHHEAA